MSVWELLDVIEGEGMEGEFGEVGEGGDINDPDMNEPEGGEE